MRIFQAIKYHFQKHMLDYGIVSAVVTLAGAIMIDKVVHFAKANQEDSLSYFARNLRAKRAKGA